MSGLWNGERVDLLPKLELLLEVFHEHLGGLESGDLVLGDDDGGVLGNVTGGLLRAGLDDEAAETAQVDGFAVGE